MKNQCYLLVEQWHKSHIRPRTLRQISPETFNVCRWKIVDERWQTQFGNVIIFFFFKLRMLVSLNSPVSSRFSKLELKISNFPIETSRELPFFEPHFRCSGVHHTETLWTDEIFLSVFTLIDNVIYLRYAHERESTWYIGDPLELSSSSSYAWFRLHFIHRNGPPTVHTISTKSASKVERDRQTVRM